MNSPALRRSPRRLRTGTLLVALATLATTLTPAAVWATQPTKTAPVAADEAPADPASLGSKLRPAGSCWEIKKERPDASSGSYWLWTPQFKAAEQFYCDQETDGGGWLLLGRGREGWDRSQAGMGSPDDVRDTVTGPSAFAPRALSSEVINGLYNGERADAQEMRLRRALDGAGTSWQQTRYRYASNSKNPSGMPTWSWSEALGSNMHVTGVTFDGTSARPGYDTIGLVGTLQNVASIYSRADTWNYGGAAWSFHKTSPLPGASTAADSYIYQTSGRLNVPFTQVYARPKVSSSDFPAVPESGIAGARNKAVVKSGTMKNPWGVTGRSPKFRDNLDVEVQAFDEDTTDDIMYVGGNFTTVQRDKAGKDAVQQEFLAAFDAKTGEWIPTFLPKLDGQVKSIKVLPGGRVAVGGEFSTADGQAHEGFVVLDKKTGRIHEDSTTQLINRLNRETVSVWDMEIEDDWLYLGGKFTHATGKPGAREVYSRNLMRFSLEDLTPDRTFTQELNGGAVDLDIHNGRLYAAGTFSKNKGADAFRAMAINLADNTQIPWRIHTSYGSAVLNTRQYGIVATDHSVWVTGAEHLTASYDPEDLSLIQTWITIAGGDGQTIASNGETVFAGCHCWGRTYEGARTYRQGSSNFESISAIGAYDAKESTIQRTPEVWDPVLSARRGEGAWASYVDSRGTLWVGGDMTHGRPDGWAARRWSGAFVRFQQAADAEAPATPAGLAAVTDGTWDKLSWKPSGAEDLTYQVFRIGSGNLIAQTSGTTVTVPAGPQGSRYVVRAIDAAGNMSATSEAVVAEPGEIEPERIPDGADPDAPRQARVIEPGTSWSYSFGTGMPQGWPVVESLESSGVAPLGWGTQDVATTFPAGADGTRPLTSYYARSFEIPAETSHKELVVTVRIDDGAALYLNGKEIHRENLPDGKLADRTYAAKSVPGNAAPDNTATVRIPVSELTAGTNTITAEVHANWTKAPSSTFDLEAALR